MSNAIVEQRIPSRMPLEEKRVIKLSSASSEALFSIMENPPEPNEYLKNALQYRKETFG